MSPQVLVQSPARTEVFISYNHRDAGWPGRLHFHLKPLVQEQLIEIRDDTMIAPSALRASTWSVNSKRGWRVSVSAGRG